MNIQINPSDSDKAAQALIERHCVRYVGYRLLILLKLLLLILFAVFMLCIWMAIPVQAFYEAIYWLKHDDWMNYNWVWLIGPERSAELVYGPNLGVNRIVNWLLHTWISLPLLLPGLVIPAWINSN